MGVGVCSCFFFISPRQTKWIFISLTCWLQAFISGKHICCLVGCLQHCRGCCKLSFISLNVESQSKQRRIDRSLHPSSACLNRCVRSSWMRKRVMNVLVRTRAITPFDAPPSSAHSLRHVLLTALCCHRRPRSPKVSHHTRPEVPESRRTSNSLI